MNIEGLKQCLNMGVAGGILSRGEADEALVILTAPEDREKITEELLTPKEICNIFKISLWTFHNWKKKGFFTPYSIGGGFPKYKKTEVFNTLQKRQA